MKFAADSHYEKGSTHTICQDYAWAGSVSDSRLVAVVCDGCSKAPDSNIGASLLAHAFKLEAPGDLAGLRSRVADRLVAGLSCFGLPAPAGRATVLGWVIDAHTGMAHGYAWGDGFLAVRRGDKLEAWVFRHPHNAPPYLGYWTNPADLKEYVEGPTFGLKMTVEHFPCSGASASSVAMGMWDIHIPIGDLPVSFAAGSDGAMSFCGGGATLPPLAVVKELTAFRDTEPGFVCRRMRRQMHLWGRLETPMRAADDVAAAAIQITPNPLP
jgi:hypothetical protein